MIRRRFLQLLGMAPVAAPLATASLTAAARPQFACGGVVGQATIPVHFFGEVPSQAVMPAKSMAAMLEIDTGPIQAEIDRLSDITEKLRPVYDAAMSGDKIRLTTIEGDRPAERARAGRRQAMDEDEQVTCWRCLADIDIETSAVVQVTLAPRRTPAGRKTGGTKIWACAHCLARGLVTELIGS